MNTDRLRLAIAIPTFRRPERLQTLLDSLAPRFAEVPEADATVFVIDNDPEQSAADVATAERADISVVYSPEPRPGIAAARQHALDAAEGFDLLVFIDDDEVPRREWLSALVACWRRTGADAVAGRVHTNFPVDADAWAIASGLFDRPRRRQDEMMPAAGAGNLLLDLKKISAAGVQFDLSLGLFGGEDTLFTRQIVRRGGKIVACPESVADDELEPGRATRAFSLARARHHGQTQVVVELRLARGARDRVIARFRNALKGTGWMARGAIRAVTGIVTRSLTRRATGIRQMHRGLGLVQGSLGLVRPEYARPSTARRRSLRGALGAATRRLSPFFRSVTAVRTPRQAVVLTLDDGPDPHWTPQILDVLAARGATATFFVLLTRTRCHPELVQRILEEGHEIALHGADHRHLSSLDAGEVTEALRRARSELEALIGRPVRRYRPPYGALTTRTWRAVRGAGMIPVLWTTSVLDGSDTPHSHRLDRATRGVRAGSIVLAHDSRAGIDDGVDDPAITHFDRAALIADVVDAYAKLGLGTVSLDDAMTEGRAVRQMILVG